MATSHSLCASVYQPLHFESISRPIRLLRINPLAEPDTFWDPPRCELLTVDLETAPEYVALSYRWGDLKSNARTIYIAGIACKVTDNLYSFLCYFRNNFGNCKGHTYLWIDQLCINQKDVDERSRTVRFMAEIYSRATGVVAWLGHDRETVRAARFLKDDPERHLVALLNNLYFTRLWIVQEVLLARGVRFLCGSIWVSYSELSTALINAEEQVLNQVLEQVQNPSAVMIADWMERGDNRSFVNFILYYSGNQCSDPRDKVYALVGLIKKEETLTVDYAKSVSEVFIDTIKVLARASYEYEDAPTFAIISWRLANNMGFGFVQLRHIGRFLYLIDNSGSNEISDAWFDQVLEHLSSSEKTRQQLGNEDIPISNAASEILRN
jgi:hypothetical protein